jgi:hypothetical protein
MPNLTMEYLNHFVAVNGRIQAENWMPGHGFGSS